MYFKHLNTALALKKTFECTNVVNSVHFADYFPGMAVDDVKEHSIKRHTCVINHEPMLLSCAGQSPHSCVKLISHANLSALANLNTYTFSFVVEIIHPAHVNILFVYMTFPFYPLEVCSCSLFSPLSSGTVSPFFFTHFVLFSAGRHRSYQRLCPCRHYSF